MLFLFIVLCTSAPIVFVVVVLCSFLSWYALLYVLSSFLIIMTEKSELVVLLLLSF